MSLCGEWQVPKFLFKHKSCRDCPGINTHGYPMQARITYSTVVHTAVHVHIYNVHNVFALFLHIIMYLYVYILVQILVHMGVYIYTYIYI